MQAETPVSRRPAKGIVAPVLNVFGLVDRRQTGWFVLMLVVLAAAAFITLGFGIVIKDLVDSGFAANDPAHLNHSLAIMLAMVTGLALSSFARLAISGWLAEQMVSRLRLHAFSHLLDLDPAFYQKRQSAEISSSLSADLTTIGTVIATSMPMVARHSLMILGGLSMLVTTSVHLTLLVLVVLPLVALPVVIIGRLVRRNAKTAQEHAGALGGMVGETLASIQTVQSYNAQKGFLARFESMTDASGKAAMRQVYSRSAMVSSIIFILFVSLCTVMWVGAHDVMAGRMSAGELTSFVFYAGVVASAFGVLGDMGAALFRASAAMDRVRDILGQAPKIASPEVVGDTPVVTGSVRIENVCFRYDPAARNSALDGVTMSIMAGETVAIVGDSGAGKTTLFQLMMRFYDPEAGRILLDGRDLRAFDLGVLRSAIAYVPQDSALFSGSVRDNILLGDPKASPEQVEAAARDAMAHDFIMALPQGYDTPLGERGMRLSGGQKQRIALARALLKPAPVLLLDEATASLDSANEKSIQEAVRTLHGRRTVMIIAHRLSTVLEADRIFVMQRGRIVEEGTHANLLAQGGIYARMVSQQFAVAEDRARREYPDLSGRLQ